MEWILPVALIVGFLILLLLVGFMLKKSKQDQQMMLKQIMLENERQSNRELDTMKLQMLQEMGSVKDKLSADLLGFQTLMSQSIKTDIHQLNDTTVSRLVNIETKVNDGLMKGFESTNKAFSSMAEHMARIDETQQNLKNLSGSISSLQNVLMDKKTRGTYGEIELYSILENVFGQNEKRYQKQYKLSNGTIADAVLFAPEPLGIIVIDSKFPLENYNRMNDQSSSTEEINKATNDFAKDVKKHIQDIASKYVQANETAEFAYMFIPAEAVFAQIVGRFDEIMDFSYQQKVYLVSPTTLMAYITAIKAIYLGQQRDEKVAQMQQEFIKLAKEFDRFSERWASVEKDFDRTYKNIQSVNVTTDKIVRRFKQIESVEFEEESNEDLAEIE